MSRIATAFALGIVIATFFLDTSAAWISLAVATCCIMAIVATLFIHHPAKRHLTTPLVMLSTMACGSSYTLTYKIINHTVYPSHIAQYDIVITSEPIIRTNSIGLNGIIASGHYEGKKVSLAFEKDSTAMALTPGMGIEALCMLKKPAGPNDDPRFALHRQSQGIAFFAFLSHHNYRKKAVSTRGLALWERARIGALTIRHKAICTLRDNGLNGDALATVSAMVLADKSHLSQKVYDSFSSSGAAHVLALSGTHLSILFFLITIFVKPIRSKWYVRAFTIITIWGYVFLVGLPTSAVRAAVMLSWLTMTRIYSKSSSQLHNISLTALILMIANPMAIFDISLQMSMMAVIAIVTLVTPLTGSLMNKIELMGIHLFHLSEGNALKYVVSATILTIVAQTATAPLAAYYFGRLPLYFILTNFITLPLATIVIYLTMVILVMSPLPIVPSMATPILQAIVSLLNNLLAAISSLPFAAVRIECISLPVLLFLYLAGFIIVTYLQLKQRKQVNNSKFNKIH